MTEPPGWNGRGSDRRWRHFRTRILERDSPTGRAQDARCQLTYPNICLTHANNVHHLEPWTGHPADANPDRCIAACGPCNKHAGQPTTQDPEPKPWPQN